MTSPRPARPVIGLVAALTAAFTLPLAGLGAVPALAAPVVADWFAALPTGSAPEAILAGADHALYTVNSGSDSVSKVGADGSVDAAFRSNLPAGSLPQSIAQDARGRLYVTSLTLSALYRLDPVTGQTDTAFSAALGHALDGRHPIAVATDSSGQVFTLNSGDETVSRLSPDGVELDRIALSPTAESQSLGFADDGQLYVVNAGDHTVSRISLDPAGHAVVVPSWAVLAPALHPLALAFDHHDFVYTVSSVGDTVSKIDLTLPPGRNVVANTVDAGARPFAITSDPAGNVYTTDLGTNTVSLYAADGSVHSEVVALGGTPFAESIDAADDGAVYLANSDTSSVARVDLVARIVSAAPDATATVGSHYSHTVVATGLDPLRYVGIGTMPPGLALDSATGVLSGDPAGAGTYDVDLLAVNAIGQSAPQHVRLTVSLPAGSTGCWFWREACGL
ncbi:putative Ig domain-containing protein [Subtercola sp. YIM 133946]|uniref:putative Ig domain-containing protein n=1 Tax=Subtercola sp. YIM 133946 TaxID=3118909 RepID=UPI002F9294A8